ncbi:hypothetical protein MOQ06_06145 [Enterobacter sp. I4]|uniref:hypothetical protein n=1 Tax=Enterobacter sp. I4 TaxID=2926672 RepID=UPI001FEF662D|nr:hypothetical protein [Enterobacter sp. I4]MCE1523657.1 hypothetical protein [Enterobacter hormaechei]MCI2290968.1 hypothetical protein [Enterobacter sp. I4]
MKRFMGTPGPWVLDEFDNVVHGNVDGWGRKESVRVSGVALPGRVTEEYAANTRLVSAAPDLLEALQEVVKVLDGAGCEAATVKSKAAISKALGEE